MTPEQAGIVVGLAESMWLAVLVLGVIGSLVMGLAAARLVRP